VSPHARRSKKFRRWTSRAPIHGAGHHRQAAEGPGDRPDGHQVARSACGPLAGARGAGRARKAASEGAPGAAPARRVSAAPSKARRHSRRRHRPSRLRLRRRRRSCRRLSSLVRLNERADLRERLRARRQKQIVPGVYFDDLGGRHRRSKGRALRGVDLGQVR
jgi:hypothetical protein